MARRHVEDFVNPLSAQTLYEVGFGDKGLPPLISVDELLALVEYAAEKGAWVRKIEAYRLKDGLEYPAIEYGIYGVPDEALALPNQEKIEFMKREIRIMLSGLAEEPNPFGFQVWTDDGAE